MMSKKPKWFTHVFIEDWDNGLSVIPKGVTVTLRTGPIKYRGENIITVWEYGHWVPLKVLRPLTRQEIRQKFRYK